MTTALEKAGVPEPTIEFGAVTTGLGATFHPRGWKILVRQADFAEDKNRVDDVTVETKVNDLFHEARHAEQFFIAARMIAGKPATSRTAEERLIVSALRGTAAWARAERTPITLAADDRRTVESWVKDYSKVKSVMAELAVPMATRRALEAELTADLRNMPGALPRRKDREAWTMQVDYRASQVKELRADLRTVFKGYLALSLEQDAYRTTSGVGADIPDAAGLTDRACYWVNDLLRTLQTLLATRIAEAGQPQPGKPADPPTPVTSTAPPPTPAQITSTTVPPTPVTSSAPPPTTDTTVPPGPTPGVVLPPLAELIATPPQTTSASSLAGDAELVPTGGDEVVQRHAMPEEIEQAVDE